MARLGESFDGLMRPVSEGMHPGMSANDGLDQTVVVRTVRRTIAIYCGCSVLGFGSPRNSDFLAIPVAGGSGRYQQVIAGNDDVQKRINAGRRTVGVFVLLTRLEGGSNHALNVRR